MPKAKVTRIYAQPATPAEEVSQLLQRENLTQDQLADALNVSRLTVNQLANGKRRMTADMAVRFAKVSYLDAEELMSLQNRVDLAAAWRTKHTRLKSLVRRKGR